MKVNKHRAMVDWVLPFLNGEYLYFESSEAYPNVKTLVPNYGDYINYIDICGSKYKSYTFVFIGYEQIDTGTNDVNFNNMEIFDNFILWLEEQQDNRNFPEFGDNCTDYEIIPLQNMANLAQITEDNLAKYMLGVRINYKED